MNQFNRPHTLRKIKAKNKHFADICAFQESQWGDVGEEFVQREAR